MELSQCLNDTNETNNQLACIVDKLEYNQQQQEDSLKVIFLVCCSALVFLMQAGFAMICSGCVRKKNVQNTLLKSLLDVCGSCIAWFCTGYAFAFGCKPDRSSFIGASQFALAYTGNERQTYLTYIHWVFQMTFAASSATIVAGTLAERCQMVTYVYFSAVLTGFVYPVIAHNIWSPCGFLSISNSSPLLGLGVHDFAGSGVVHVTGGCSALIATILLGPRTGRFYNKKGELLDEPAVFPGHSKSLQMLGSMLLWVGWFGFNAGSAVDIYNTNQPLNLPAISSAVVNTSLAGSSAGLVALFFNLFIQERILGEPMFKLSAAMNGCLTGLAAVTGSCAFIEPWAAIVIGLVAGCVYLFSSHLLVKFRLDDAVDAIPVHLFGGCWGLIATAFFASPRGLKYYYGLGDESDVAHVGAFYSWGQGSFDLNILACQLIGIVFILGWTTATMLPFFLFLSYLGILRSDSFEELVGLDVSYHGYTPRVVGDEIGKDQLNTYLKRTGKYNLELNPEEDNTGMDRFED